MPSILIGIHSNDFQHVDLTEFWFRYVNSPVKISGGSSIQFVITTKTHIIKTYWFNFWQAVFTVKAGLINLVSKAWFFQWHRRCKFQSEWQWHFWFQQRVESVDSHLLTFFEFCENWVEAKQCSVRFSQPFPSSFYVFIWFIKKVVKSKRVERHFKCAFQKNSWNTTIQ